jgi:glycosyltransferase involved in cell wall biosynthesis
MLRRAVHSVMTQTEMPTRISVEIDSWHEGSAATRNRALANLTTEWTAFLDDDDVFLPAHIQSLREHAEDTGADVVYSWPEMNGGPDPSPDRFGVPFDPELLKVRSYIPVTSLVRSSAISSSGARFRTWKGTPYDDWGFYCQLLEAGAQFSHRPERTWVWNIHNNNTSGRGDRW